MRSMISLYKIFLCILILASVSFGVEADKKIELHDLLSQANQTFNAANETSDGQQASELYIKAANLYERAAQKGGLENAAIYYNIGNSYLLAGDLGRAIYNYKKAMKYDPADPLLQRNLAVARAKRIDRVDVEMEKKVLSTLFFWHYDFSLRARFYSALIIFALMMLAASVKLRFKSAAGLRPVIFVFGLLLVCFAGSVLVEVVNEKTHTQGVIVASELVARKGDSEKYEKAFEEPLHSGTEFELLEKRPDWLRVRLADGSELWLPEAGCKLL